MSVGANLELPRRGARSPKLVPPNILLALNGGAASVNHMEQMAIDMAILFASTFPDAEPSLSVKRGLSSSKFITRLRAGGEGVLELPGAIERAAAHQSDTVRGWGAFAVAELSAWLSADLIAALKPFAADPHFAVREWAWLAARPTVVMFVEEFVEAAKPFTSADDPNLRRFTSEATRPRGVWSAHIPPLVQNPEIARAIVEPLATDESRYVQLSIGNWLNDAGKSNERWVIETLDRWDREKRDVSRVVLNRAKRSFSSGS